MTDRYKKRDIQIMMERDIGYGGAQWIMRQTDISNKIIICLDRDREIGKDTKSRYRQRPSYYVVRHLSIFVAPF